MDNPLAYTGGNYFNLNNEQPDNEHRPPEQQHQPQDNLVIHVYIPENIIQPPQPAPPASSNHSMEFVKEGLQLMKIELSRAINNLIKCYIDILAMNERSAATEGRTSTGLLIHREQVRRRAVNKIIYTDGTFQMVQLWLGIHLFKQLENFIKLLIRSSGGSDETDENDRAGDEHPPTTDIPFPPAQLATAAPRPRTNEGGR